MDSNGYLDFYLKKDEWSKQDIEKIFAHLSNIEFNRLVELILASVSIVGAKKLKHRRTGSSLSPDGISYFFDPFNFIRWAIVKEIRLPNELNEWYKKQCKPEPKPKVNLPPYLDLTHPLHSTELAIAIEAWTAVLQSNPDRPKTGSRKQLIEKWLRVHHQELLNNEIERITVMLNPDKKH